MHKYSKRLQLPYSAEQLFELVLDVEKYPEFVPGWHAAKIRARGDNTLSVEQTVGVGPLRWSFMSQAQFERPRRITITAIEEPFRELRLDWRFEKAPGGCLVDLDVTCSFVTNRLGRLSDAMTSIMSDGIIAAFEHRASQTLREPATSGPPGVGKSDNEHR